MLPPFRGGGISLLFLATGRRAHADHHRRHTHLDRYFGATTAKACAYADPIASGAHADGHTTTGDRASVSSYARACSYATSVPRRHLVAH